MTLFDGITARTLTTERGAIGILEREADDPASPADKTIVFIHNGISSAEFWQKTMLALPQDLRLIAVDLRGYGRSETLPVDATRGARDFADDLHAAVEVLDLGLVHFVGWGFGAGVLLQYALDHPAASLTLESPVSPYGFGGTRRDGSRISEDDAGAGAGIVSGELLRRLEQEDESTDSADSPRSFFRTLYLAPGYVSQNEDVWIDSMLTTATGAENFPGSVVESANWPGFAPGTTGVMNAFAPRWFNVSGIVELAEKPPILWVRGNADSLISDASKWDVAVRGKHGLLQDWPGASSFPAQPMVSQTRDVLDAYAEAGGHVVEAVFDGVGHTPHLEEPEDFRAALLRRIDYVRSYGPPTEMIILRAAD